MRPRAATETRRVQNARFCELDSSGSCPLG